MRAYGVKSLAIFCINSLLLWFVQSYGSDFFCPTFGIVGRLQETRWYCRKERMTEGGKCAKKYINASDCSWRYIRCEKWSFRARSHSFNAHTHFHRAHTNTHLNLPPIRNRIQIETRKKIQLENFVWGKLSRVMLSNDTRLYTYPYSAHNTRARSHHGHNAVS